MGTRLKNFTENLDSHLAIVGAIGAIALALWLALNHEMQIFVVAAIFAFAACITYLILRKRLSHPDISSSISSLPQLRAKPSVYLTLNIMFFALFSYSIISIVLRPELYVRPLGYFISIALMVGLLALEIVFLPRRRIYTYFVLVKIMLIALSLRWVPQYIFPGLVWYDPWWHQWFTAEILKLGQIPADTPYTHLPIMHLLIASTMLITNFSYKVSAMVSVGLLQVILYTVFVFIIADRFIHSPRIGLLAALLLGVADMSVMRGICIYPNALGAILIVVLIYLLFKSAERESVGLKSMVIFFMAVLILTHTLSAAAMAIILLCFFFGFQAYSSAYGSETKAPATIFLCALFAVGMFGWWMYVSGFITDVARMIRWGFSKEYLGGLPPETTVQFLQQIPLSEYLLDRLGFILFFVFSLIGSFHLLSRRFRNGPGFVMTIAGLVFLGLGYVGYPLRLITAARWEFLSQLVLAIPAAFGLVLIYAAFKNRLIAASALTILVLVMSFSMVSDKAVNFDNPLISPTRIVRRAFTESEIKSMDTLTSIYDGKIGSDSHACSYMHYESQGEVAPISDSLISRDFGQENNKLIIIRDYITNNTFDCRGSFRLNYDPCEALTNEGFNCNYDSGSVRAFLRQAGEIK